MERMTEEEYLAKAGAVCPYCRSDQIQSSSNIDFGGTMLFQPVKCHACGKEWTDSYKLTGYEEVE